MASFSEEITIESDRDKIWDVLADIGSIHRWNPGVINSHAVHDDRSGLGCERHCELPGSRYLDEEVVEWEPNSRLTMRIVGSNLPFDRADIQFRLEDLAENRTQVTVAPDYVLKFGRLGRLLNRFAVQPAYRKGMADLLVGLKTYVEEADQKGS